MGEEQIGDSAAHIEADLPLLYNIPAIQMQYPVRYDESMNTVLVQELQKFNRLLRVVQKSLKDLQLALKGLVVMSGELEQMGTEMFNQLVPGMWMNLGKSYPSLKPLSAYMTGTLQNYARKTKYPIDQCSFAHIFIEKEKA